MFAQHQLIGVLLTPSRDINVIDLLTITHRLPLIQTRWRVVAVFLKESPCYTFSFKDLVIRTFLDHRRSQTYSLPMRETPQP